MQRLSRSITCSMIAAAALMAGCASGPDSGPSKRRVVQMSFASPEDAVAALAYAANSGDRAYGRSLFGPEADQFSSGDPEVDAHERGLFVAAIQRRHDLRQNADGSYDILVGEKAEPFPAPIVNVAGRWMFDTPAGVERLTDIRVGFHELKTIESLRAVAQAQTEYQSVDRNGDGVLEYASRILSTPGTRDGLYWSTRPNEPNSPIGAYFVEGEVPASASLGYNGYFYRVLTSQGPGAPGGAKSYLDAAGRLVGGYAVLAYPAQYGETAVMTFQMGADGVVYQKNLGPNETPTAGNRITAFNPSGGWARASE